MNCDMHVHTQYSCDSDADMEGYNIVAKERNIDVICFTDHVDYNVNDEGYGYYKPDHYFEKFNSIKEKCNIELLSGIEFSEPHLYYNQLKELQEFPYDYIIGSVHWVGNMFPCLEVRSKILAKDFYSLYWKEVTKAVEQGGFDCLGHIDFPKRYYRELYYDEKEIIHIFKMMHKKKIVLEINTSSLRKGLSESMPDKALLALYKETGGIYITIGTDSHRIEELGEGIAYAKGLISELGLVQVVFRKRVMQVI